MDPVALIAVIIGVVVFLVIVLFFTNAGDRMPDVDRLSVSDLELRYKLQLDWVSKYNSSVANWSNPSLTSKYKRKKEILEAIDVELKRRRNSGDAEPIAAQEAPPFTEESAKRQELLMRDPDFSEQEQRKRASRDWKIPSPSFTAFDFESAFARRRYKELTDLGLTQSEAVAVWQDEWKNRPTS